MQDELTHQWGTPWVWKGLNTCMFVKSSEILNVRGIAPLGSHLHSMHGFTDRLITIPLGTEALLNPHPSNPNPPTKTFDSLAHKCLHHDPFPLHVLLGNVTDQAQPDKSDTKIEKIIIVIANHIIITCYMLCLTQVFISTFLLQIRSYRQGSLIWLFHFSWQHLNRMYVLQTCAWISPLSARNW